MSDAQWGGLFDNIEIKEAALLNRYFAVAFQMLNKKDGSKYTRTYSPIFLCAATKNLIDYPKLIKMQLKMHETHGSACLLKSAFDKRNVGFAM